MTITPLDQEALDTAARCQQTVQHGVGRALPLVQRIAERIDKPGELDTCVGLLMEALRAAESAQQALVYALGAQNPGLRVARDTLRLDQLDTEATRDLLSSLQETLRLAQTVDRERGWVDEEGYCTGFAETVAGWELGLRREIHGAQGGGRE